MENKTLIESAQRYLEEDITSDEIIVDAKLIKDYNGYGFKISFMATPERIGKVENKIVYVSEYDAMREFIKKLAELVEMNIDIKS
jgi:hypothetical protein